MNHPATFELSTTDTMTNLVNAAYFRHLLREQLVPQALNDAAPLSLFLFDLDNFHEINVTKGKEAGDAVLKTIASTLQAAMPENAIISRYGGDEFAVALPDTRLDDAFSLAEEFRRQVAGLQFEGLPNVHLTCSIGLAGMPGNSTSEVELFREADQAAYTAKLSGRNKVSLPLQDRRMVMKTSHYTSTQLDRLAELAKTLKRNEASVLREALDDVLKKYNDRLGAAPKN